MFPVNRSFLMPLIHIIILYLKTKVLGEDKLFFTSEPGDGVGADDCTSDFACSISSKNSNNQSNESKRLPDGMVLICG